MTALADNRAIPQWGTTGIPHVLNFPQKGTTTIFQGGLCVLNAGYLAPGTVATGLIAVGVASALSKNTGADGAVNAECEAGVFPFKNSASGDLIAQADVGGDCFIVDDQTVAKTSATNTRSKAGKVIAVDANYVWVLVGISV